MRSAHDERIAGKTSVEKGSNVDKVLYQTRYSNMNGVNRRRHLSTCKTIWNGETHGKIIEKFRKRKETIYSSWKKCHTIYFSADNQH